MPKPSLAWPVCAALLAACGALDSSSPDDTDPIDTDVDTRRLPDTAGDSDAVWDTSSEGERPDLDTYTVVDEPLGPTPLDGTWRGTFRLFEERPLNAPNPVCDGFFAVEIDGDGDRHVVTTFDCRSWLRSPRPPLGPYGPLEGIGFATLDPADFSRAVAEITLGASSMTRVDLTGVRLRFNGTTVTINHDTVQGFGGLAVGHILTGTAELGAPPPDTDPPVDTADTDIVVPTGDTADTDIVLPTGDTADTDIVLPTGDTADTDIVVPTGDTADTDVVVATADTGAR